MIRIPQNSASGTGFDAALAESLAVLRQRISRATTLAARDVHSVTLLAVTKGQTVPRIRQAMALGLSAFGENYVDEAMPKIGALANSGASWHFIGRLQANKTRVVAQHFAWVHGVDRLRIAARLSEQRPPGAPPLNVCIQVRVADDPARAGVAPDEVLPLARQIAALPHLALRGLMCMLPYASPPDVQHVAFGQMRRLVETARAALLPLDTLSMGMSADLEAAIAEGATMVRVGTALFGPRARVE
jgi:pyridoxal phosphate enzyme (YggS family)